MRILYSFPHAIGAPGIGTTAINQVRGLLARGHQVDVVAASVHAEAGGLPTVTRTMVVGGARIPHRLFGRDRSVNYHDGLVAAHLRRHPSTYDVVHCWPGAVLKTCVVAASLDIPTLREVPNTHTANAYQIVATLSALLEIEIPRGHSHRNDAGRLQKEEREYQTAKFLLVPSEHVRSTFIERNMAVEKLLLHQYGFDPETFVPLETPRSGPLRVVFLGAVEPRKGVHIALEAWRRARMPGDAELVIHGRILESYRRVLESFRDLSNVRFSGFTDNAAQVLRGADVLVLPSFEEGSALVTYEAQGAGVVPLVSDATGARCTHEVNAMIHPTGDIDTLAGHLRRLNADRTLLLHLREGALAHRNELTWDHAARRLEGCYELSRRHARATVGAPLRP